MAIFHHSTQVIGRSTGRSVVAAAAYRLGVEMVDERTGRAFDFSRKGGVDSWTTLAPDHAPAWVHNPGQLWNQVEAAEKRKDAQLCREINIALPVELPADQVKALALDYARDQFVSRGMIAQVAFHDMDGTNPHCHIMLTMREIGPDGFGKKQREWNDHSLATDYRRAWAERANAALEREGHASRIDHRSLEEQGIERQPQQHLGPIASAMEKRGKATDRQRYLQAPAGMDHEQARADLEREAEAKAKREREAQSKRHKAELDQADRLVIEAGIKLRVARNTGVEAKAKAKEAWGVAVQERERAQGVDNVVFGWECQAKEAAEAYQEAKQKRGFFGRLMDLETRAMRKAKRWEQTARASIEREMLPGSGWSIAQERAAKARSAAERAEHVAQVEAKTKAERVGQAQDEERKAIERRAKVIERHRVERLTPQERDQERARVQEQREALARRLEASRRDREALERQQALEPQQRQQERGRGLSR